jgi:hypothetical protein
LAVVFIGIICRLLDLGFAFFGVLLSAVGAAGVYATKLRGLRELKRSHDWDSTTGEVIVSGILKGSPHYRGKRLYTDALCLGYTYVVAGKEYRGEHVGLGGMPIGICYSSQAQGELARKYPVGSTPRVYYDPKNPENCCLERVAEGSRGGYFGLVGLLALGLVLIAVDIYQFLRHVPAFQHAFG